jgi:hypothetical protein
LWPTWGNEMAPRHQRALIAVLNGKRCLKSVALDGPLTHDLRIIGHYRSCESVLSRGPLQKLGKPGQTSSGTGRQLHRHATSLAKMILEMCDVAEATHYSRIHKSRLVEAFPTAFLLALQPSPPVPPIGRAKSDLYWGRLLNEGMPLDNLLKGLLPRRGITYPIHTIRNHDKRASFVCALTALAVLLSQHIAIGDEVDGDIVLPPLAAWGKGNGFETPWLLPVLQANVNTTRVGSGNHRAARIADHCRQLYPPGAIPLNQRK